MVFQTLLALTKKMTTELPPNSYLRRYGTRYREAWRLAEALRSRRGKDGFPDWPEWCYVPAWYVERHIVSPLRIWSAG
jgi:hypothetical protein